jgi:uncharacterized protein
VILLDTTVLSYAVGAEHPLREPCRRLLQAHADGRIEAATTIEVVQEFLEVRARRRSRPDAVALARYYMAALPMLVTRAHDLEMGLALFERHPALGAFDAVLAAVALNERVEALVSADRGFDSVANLPWVDPTTSNLDDLTGR